MNKKDLLKKLKKDILRTEWIIEHPDLYNRRNEIICYLANMGIVLDRCIPFFVLAPSLFVLLPDNFKPFKVYHHPIYSTITTIDTSLGYHDEKELFESTQGNSIEYSTGWVLQDDCYERFVTRYLYSNVVLKDKDDLFDMSKEELDNKLCIIKNYSVKKKRLKSKDHFYDDDMLVIVSNKNSSNVVGFRNDSVLEWSVKALVYLYVVAIGGGCLVFLKSLYGPKFLEDKLTEIENNHKGIANIHELKKVLAMKKENLSLLEDNKGMKR